MRPGRRHYVTDATSVRRRLLFLPAQSPDGPGRAVGVAPVVETEVTDKFPADGGGGQAPQVDVRGADGVGQLRAEARMIAAFK